MGACRCVHVCMHQCMLSFTGHSFAAFRVCICDAHVMRQSKRISLADCQHNNELKWPVFVYACGLQGKLKFDTL